MLYFCFPVYFLKDDDGKIILNRPIKIKEKGFLEINQNNIFIFLELLKIFGILSPNHRQDILEILNFILKNHL